MATTLTPERRGRAVLRAAEAAFYGLWKLLTSVRNAISAVLLLGLLSLLGVVLPQVPAQVRGDALLTDAWLEQRRANFGPFTSLLHRTGLFDLFQTWWFWGLVTWVALAVVVCTYSRFPGIQRQVFRPPRRVGDGLFERPSAARIAGASPAGIERELRRRRFKVERTEEGGTTYLFADRFAWTQLGTFASHLALILFLAGALVTSQSGFETDLTIAEGASAPVFPVKNERQILVQVDDAVGAFDEEGRPVDYHSDLVLYKNGEEAKRCTITVNSPCSLDGYRFHQAGFFGFGGELRVRDLTTGNTIYNETLALSSPMPAPNLTVTGSDGETLLDGPVPQTDLVPGSLGALLSLGAEDEEGRVFWTALRGEDDGWMLVVFDATSGVDGNQASIPLDGSATVSGFTFEFTGLSRVPTLMPTGVPLPVDVENAEGDGRVLLAMENAVFGTADASAGDVQLGGTSDGPPILHIAGISPLTIRLAEGETVELGPYEYEFVGPSNFAGISVRKDSGDMFIWVATGLFLFGLAMTLWIPRRRAWFRFRDGEMRMFSQGRSRLDPETVFGDDASSEADRA